MFCCLPVDRHINGVFDLFSKMSNTPIWLLNIKKDSLYLTKLNWIDDRNGMISEILQSSKHSTNSP